nr:probable cinnamyl alcohol dehydrogenase 1 [Tanacetum cinerariifolium]
MTSDAGNENCLGWAARDPSGFLSPYRFDRRDVGVVDVSITITHCGVCYADVAWTRNKQGHSKYPLVPGHEIVGIVKEVGSNVQRFKAGDHIGVGTYVNSCRDCEYCDDGREVQCSKGAVLTFDGIDTDGTPGKSLGVIGLGGLGHLAVKFGKSFGLKVTVFSTSPSKRDEALNLLGADNFIISSNNDEMKAVEKSLDFLINTASADIPFDLYLSLLKSEGVLSLVGFPSEVKFNPASLILGMRSIAGSITGGTKQTQEMLDYCAAHEIYPNIDIVPIQYANEALERLIKKDVKYRFVIDIASSLK